MIRKETSLFLLGFLSCALVFYFIFYVGSEIPFGTGMATLTEISPSDWINREDILVKEDYILIKVSGASISNYADTGSMKPLIDENSNGIRIVPKSSEDINVGDIISYEKEGRLFVHRITGTGFDESGVYFVVQGDNANYSDGKIRFEEIRYVTIGVLW